jgi:dihydrolipoamide dehydrogenase
MSSAEQVFDVVVIGAGPGGYVAAIRSAQLGFKTAIIEGHKLGGECLNYGCIPSKALITAGHLVDKIHHGEKMGIKVSGLSVDLDKLVDWKAGIVKQLTGGVGQLLKANSVSVFQGTGSFEGLSADGKLKRIKVEGTTDSYDGTAKASGGTNTWIQSQRVIIASGSSTIEIPTFKFNGRTVLGSREALDVKKIPKKIIVIGGGFIGLEIGTFFSKIGTEVAVIEATNTLLPGTDRECVDVVQKKLVKKGVKLHFQTKALNYEEITSGVRVHCEGPTGKVSLEGDWVLVTVGRRPRTQNLTLEKIGLKVNARGFIDVNNRLETLVSGVSAIGDVIGGPMLAHKASFEALVAIETFKDPNHRGMDIRALPWAIFVDPEISTVGHTEESARAAGWDPVVGKCPFAANGRALTASATEGFVKLIADRKTDRILGAHMVGPEVSNLIAQVATAIEMGATASDLSNTVHAHPTLPETVLEAAESVHGLAVHFYEKKPKHHPSLGLQTHL